MRAVDTAMEIADLGVDALGFHLWSMQNAHVRAAEIARMVDSLPEDVSSWLLTDVHDGDVLASLAEETRVDAVQIQGAVPDGVLRDLAESLAPLRMTRGLRIVKSISMEVGERRLLSQFLGTYAEIADALLLDSGWEGGRGMACDWSAAAEIRERVKPPVVLAGGLTAESVRKAIAVVRPYGVDVETGVEVLARGSGGSSRKYTSVMKVVEFMNAVAAS